MGLREDIERVALQEQELRFPRFDAETAWDLGVRLRTMAMVRGLPVAIELRRLGQPLFYTALEGTTPDNGDWVRRKSNLVARLHRSSYAIGLKLKVDNETIESKYALPPADYAAHGGAFPIHVVNAGIIGCVTVSGLPQRIDHELVIEALCAALGRDYTALKLD